MELRIFNIVGVIFAILLVVFTIYSCEKREQPILEINSLSETMYVDHENLEIKFESKSDVVRFESIESMYDYIAIETANNAVFGR